MRRSLKIRQPITLLLDENVDRRIASFLRKQKLSIRFATAGASDEYIYTEAKKIHALLVTHDSDFANSDRYKPDKRCGIIVLRIHPQTVDRVVLVFEKLFRQTRPEQLFGRIIVATPDGLSINSSGS